MQNQPVDSNELNQMIDSLRRERNGNSSSSAVRSHDGQMMPLNNPNNVSAGNDPASAGTAAAAPAAPTYNAGSTASATAPVSATNTAKAADNGNLDEIKREAVTELRPLVDKLELKPADKFDVLLLLIRSNDDSSLIADAHRTALQIDDESRRAQALLAVIQEVDYFKQKK